jgi:hypothetical protein
VIETPFSTTTVQRQLVVYPNWQFGFRLFASWRHCSDLGAIFVSYTHFFDHDRAKRIRPANQSLFQPSAFAIYARGDLITSYDKIDLRTLFRLSTWYDSRIDGFVGGRYIVLQVQRRQFASFADGSTMQFSDVGRLKGGGIEVGLRGSHQLLCGFSLCAEAAGTLTIGTRKETFHSLFFDSLGNLQTGARTDGPSSTAYIPGVDAKIGAAFTTTLTSSSGYCLSIVGEIGFCLEYFFHALRAQRVAGGTVATYENDVGFIGPYASLRGYF